MVKIAIPLSVETVQNQSKYFVVHILYLFTTVSIKEGDELRNCRVVNSKGFFFIKSFSHIFTLVEVFLQRLQAIILHTQFFPFPIPS